MKKPIVAILAASMVSAFAIVATGVTNHCVRIRWEVGCEPTAALSNTTGYLDIELTPDMKMLMALSSAGGFSMRAPDLIKLTRGGTNQTMSLSAVMRDSNLDIILKPNDLIEVSSRHSVPKDGESPNNRGQRKFDPERAKD